MQIIDADGHINDHACGEEIAKYMPPGNQMANLVPEFDHLHFRYLKQNRRATGNPSPDDWNQFLDKTGISWTVLYPTAGLAVGRIIAPDWAVVACRAYNTWLYETFLNKNSRLKGVALIPFQDVDKAILELRRVVKDLGMLGGMLPSNGEAIQGHLGNKIYWPLYEEAEKLGCALAVHVGCLHNMGLDAFSTYYPGPRARSSVQFNDPGRGDARPWRIRSISQTTRRLSRRRSHVGAIHDGPPRSFLSRWAHAA